MSHMKGVPQGGSDGRADPAGSDGAQVAEDDVAEREVYGECWNRRERCANDGDQGCEGRA